MQEDDEHQAAVTAFDTHGGSSDLDIRLASAQSAPRKQKLRVMNNGFQTRSINS
jgi:hypothetical protein